MERDYGKYSVKIIEDGIFGSVKIYENRGWFGTFKRYVGKVGQEMVTIAAKNENIDLDVPEKYIRIGEIAIQLYINRVAEWTRKKQMEELARKLFKET